MKILMSSTFVLAFLLALAAARFVDKYPDALRCGTGKDRGAMFFAHQLGDNALMYCQVWTGEARCVNFNLDGVYQTGTGHSGSRDGCTGKSIVDLEKEGRTFDIEDSKKIKQLEARVLKLEEYKKNECSKGCANFWDYEQVKQKWYSDFEAKVLQRIKMNGLQIGSRWSIQQESTYFVIRDIEGSKTKDSRIAFPAATYLDPK